MIMWRNLLTVRGHHFYAGVINENSVVVDLGAHLGEFSSALSGTFGCKCYAIEAMPYLYSRISDGLLIKKFHLCITDTVGPVKFNVSRNLECNSIYNNLPRRVDAITVPGITLEKFMREHEITYIDLLKVDIEGAEIQLFNSLTDFTLHKIGQITVEFHDFMGHLNCIEKVQEIKKRLNALGFYCIVFSRSTNSDTLFINRDRCGIPWSKLLYIKFVIKYVRGAIKVLNRRISSLLRLVPL